MYRDFIENSLKHCYPDSHAFNVPKGVSEKPIPKLIIAQISVNEMRRFIGISHNVKLILKSTWLWSPPPIDKSMRNRTHTPNLPYGTAKDCSVAAATVFVDHRIVANRWSLIDILVCMGLWCTFESDLAVWQKAIHTTHDTKRHNVIWAFFLVTVHHKPVPRATKKNI